MPSTYSPNKNYTLQATGENQGTWGVLLNTEALSIIDLNFGGRLAKTIDVANVTLTAEEQENVYITLTGTLTGNRDLIFTATAGGWFYIYNNTSGAFSVTAKPSGGTGVVCPQGGLSRVFINPTASTAVHLGIPSTPTGGTLLPIASDGTALGSTSLPFSDMYLASGGVINWANSDVLITHSSNTLAFSGASSGYTFDAAVKPSANDAAALGASGTAWSDAFFANGAVLNFNAGGLTVTQSGTTLAISGGITLGTALPVASGGTGAATLTGLLQGNGTGAITGGATINNSNWSGTDLSVANGGTGASTLTGLLQGNGTGAITGGATINNSNWSGTDLAVTNGGTGASDAATAATNLGLGAGDNVTFNSVTLAAGSNQIRGSSNILTLNPTATTQQAAVGFFRNTSTTDTDATISFNNADGTSAVWASFARTSGSTLGSPTGGAKGAGTLSAAGGLYDNGNRVYYPGGTDVAVADGGTGQSTSNAAIVSFLASLTEVGTSSIGLPTGTRIVVRDVGSGNWGYYREI